MSTRHFTKDHEWIDLDGEVATIGITDYAQGQLGDVVFVELPEIGRTLAAGDDAAVVESVKAASDVYAPIDGEVVAGNEAVVDDPSLVNTDPTGEGWFFRMRVTDAGQLDELLDEDAYAAYVAGLG